jgi:ribosome-binding protein aMBF1 (putative translation factor)
MFDPKRLDHFSPRAFLEGEEDVRVFEHAHRIQRTGVMITQLREEAGLSVGQLAYKLKRDPSEVLRIEQGRLLESPSMDLMMEIANICFTEVNLS